MCPQIPRVAPLFCPFCCFGSQTEDKKLKNKLADSITRSTKRKTEAGCTQRLRRCRNECAGKWGALLPQSKQQFHVLSALICCVATCGGREMLFAAREGKGEGKKQSGAGEAGFTCVHRCAMLQCMVKKGRLVSSLFFATMYLHVVNTEIAL